jgi:hypothetical protein
MKIHQTENSLTSSLYENSFESVPCEICGTNGALDYLRMKDHLYGVPGTFTIVKCRSSGRACIACPNVESHMSRFFEHYWAGWHLPFHFYHFTPQAIVMLIGLTDFEIVKSKARTSDLSLHKSAMAFLRGKPKDVKCDKDLPLIRSFYFRLSTMLSFRPLHMQLPGKVEFLQAEPRKPAKIL